MLRKVKVMNSRPSARAYFRHYLLAARRNFLRLEPENLRWRRVRRSVSQSYLDHANRRANKWVKERTELDNFYYDLEENNRADLSELVAAVTSESSKVISNYLSEIRDDASLRTHIAGSFANNPWRADSIVGYGRREGWYLFVRALKPRVVVETGVHDGVGACVILAALERNEEEGFGGRYFGTDINPRAGWLIPERHKRIAKILYGDSIRSLNDLDQEINLFINDSDHSPDYEGQEYEVIKPKLSPNSVILGDNSHVSDSLRVFSQENNRPYIFWHEKPADHWYPGAGIGISLSGLPMK